MYIYTRVYILTHTPAKSFRPQTFIRVYKHACAYIHTFRRVCVYLYTYWCIREFCELLRNAEQVFCFSYFRPSSWAVSVWTKAKFSFLFSFSQCNFPFMASKVVLRSLRLVINLYHYNLRR